MAEWQLMQRKRLLLGDKFRHAGVSDSEFHVREEYQGFIMGLSSDEHRAPSIRGQLSGPKKLRVYYCSGGAWEAWLDVSTGLMYHNRDCTDPVGQPFDEMVEIYL
jgi:hypothetical protein